MPLDHPRYAGCLETIMNGISPFNYRRLTPEQEKRGEKIATVISILVIIGFATFWICAAIWGNVQ
jgi:hypothetical protein